MKGFDVRENEMGFTAIRLHYSSDPLKDTLHPDPLTRERAQAWFDATRRLFPDPMMWDKEMEISWWVTAGTRVFPEFTESTHMRPLRYLSHKRLYRAWDFGWHAPACLISQIDPKDRLVLLKEVIGHQETTRQFAQRVIARCAEWYPMHTAGFQDFCDPAGQQVRPIESERSEKRDVEILNGLDIYPSWEYGWSRKDGRSLIHQLLRLRTDDTPSLYVDGAGCPTLLQAFLGKYVYPESRDGVAAEDPDETNHPWADIMAALRYLTTGLYSALGLRRFKYQPVMKEIDYVGYGMPKGKRA